MKKTRPQDPVNNQRELQSSKNQKRNQMGHVKSIYDNPKKKVRFVDDDDAGVSSETTPKTRSNSKAPSTSYKKCSAKQEQKDEAVSRRLWLQTHRVQSRRLAFTEEKREAEDLLEQSEPLEEPGTPRFQAPSARTPKVAQIQQSPQNISGTSH